MSGAGCNFCRQKPAAAVVVLSAGLWLLVWAFIFIFFPLVSELPLGCGLILGLFLFVSQFFWGQALLHLLLKIPNTADAPSLDWCDRTIAAPLPFMLALGSGPIIVAAGSFDNFDKQALRSLAQLLRERFQGFPGLVYTSLTALPCLLRALESVTSDYGKLRFAQGPLWYLGKFFKICALVLEAPLRAYPPHRLSGLSKDLQLAAASATAEFELALAQVSQQPVWMEDLDLLSPVVFPEAKRRRAVALACGDSQMKSLPERPLEPKYWRWTLAGWLLGSLVVWGGGPWGAWLLGGGLGWLVSVWRQRSGRVKDFVALDVEALTKTQKAFWIGCTVQVRGSEKGAEGVSQSGRLLTEQGELFLAQPERWPSKQGEAGLLRGWIDPLTMRLYAAEIEFADKKYRYYPRLLRSLLPSLLSFAGLLWSALQYIGL